MLEGDARQVVLAANAYATTMRSKDQYQANLDVDRPFIPLIVTNASLFVASYDSRNVSLESGQFISQPDVAPVKWVRFRKAFTSDGNVNTEEQTVLVVAAVHLPELLGLLNWISGRPLGVR
jgi:hypothetical protein